MIVFPWRADTGHPTEPLQGGSIYHGSQLTTLVIFEELVCAYNALLPSSLLRREDKCPHMPFASG